MAETDINIEEEQQQKAPRVRGRLGGFFIDILKWIAIAVGAIIFIVAVVVVTLLIFNSRDMLVTSPIPLVSQIEDSIPEELDWYMEIGELRGSTADNPRKTFIIVPVLGYEPGKDIVLQELIRRRPQIKERIRIYLSSHTADELQGAENTIKVKNELREQINRMMRNKIREVVFDTYQILDF